MFSNLHQLGKGHPALGRQTTEALDRVRVMHRHDVPVEHLGEAELFAALITVNLAPAVLGDVLEQLGRTRQILLANVAHEPGPAPAVHL